MTSKSRAMLISLLGMVVFGVACEPRVVRPQSPLTERVRSIRAGARDILSLAQGSVILDVKPRDAQVFVDDRLYGVVRDFRGRDGGLFLFPGRHVIELRHPNYEPYRVEVDLLPEQDIRIEHKMRKI